MRFNYADEIYINSGSYTITFLGGKHIINTVPSSINKYTYPILKDSSSNIINPLIWYKFDSNPGLLIDSGSLNNGSLINGSLIDIGSITLNQTIGNYIHGNGAASFPISANNFLTVANTIDLNAINISTGISFTFWVYISSITGSGGYARIFDFGKTDGTNGSKNIQICTDGTSTTRLIFSIDLVGSAANIYTSTTTNLYTWYNITWTISSDGYWTIYINNSISLSRTLKLVIPSLPLADRTYYFGKSLFTDNGSLIMYLDDFRIYGKELTATEVSELYLGRVEVYNKNTIGIGTSSPNTNYILDVNGNTNLSGRLNIFESIGTINNATSGSLTIQHANSEGVSSIVFPSTVNPGSDYGYITFIDNDCTSLIELV